MMNTTKWNDCMNDIMSNWGDEELSNNFELFCTESTDEMNYCTYNGDLCA